MTAHGGPAFPPSRSEVLRTFDDRGVHDCLADVLDLLQQAPPKMFWFAGMTVHDPFAVYDVVDAPKERFGGGAEVWAPWQLHRL